MSDADSGEAERESVQSGGRMPGADLTSVDGLVVEVYAGAKEKPSAGISVFVTDQA